jgi:hypothetical protein
LAAVTLATGGIVGVQVIKGQQDADYLAEVPLIALMFLVMVLHGRRRLAATQERLTAMEQVQRISQENVRLLENAVPQPRSRRVRARPAHRAGHRRGPPRLGPGTQHHRSRRHLRDGHPRQRRRGR